MVAAQARLVRLEQHRGEGGITVSEGLQDMVGVVQGSLADKAAQLDRKMADAAAADASAADVRRGLECRVAGARGAGRRAQGTADGRARCRACAPTATMQWAGCRRCSLRRNGRSSGPRRSCGPETNGPTANGPTAHAAAAADLTVQLEAGRAALEAAEAGAARASQQVARTLAAAERESAVRAESAADWEARRVLRARPRRSSATRWTSCRPRWSS